MTNEIRGSGRTTAQMRNAPRNAIYVWCNEKLHYPAKLLGEVDRTDITVVSPEMVAKTMIDTRRPIVVDHYAYLSSETLKRIQIHNQIVEVLS